MRFNATARLIALSLFAALLGPPAAAAQGETLTILKPVGFAERSFVRDAVRKECQLQDKLPQFIAEYAKGDFGEITFLDGAGGGDAPGKVLFVEITEVNESGNAWTGRSKALAIEGELREDGKVIGSFRSRRATQGGAFGGYKGACSFLGRCAKALGKDVAEWLKNPEMNSTISSQ
jgi:hypothetical protein